MQNYNRDNKNYKLKYENYTPSMSSISLNIFMFCMAFESINLSTGNGSLSISQITGIIYAATLLKERKITPSISSIRFIALHVALITWFAISSIFNINSSSSKIIDPSFTQNVILLGLLLSHEKNENHIIVKSLKYYSYGFIFVSILYVFGIGVTYEFGRAKIFGDDSNYVAVKSAIAFYIFIDSFDFSKNKIIKFLIVIVTISPLANLIFDTGSRTGIISFAFMGIVYLVLYWLESPAKRIGYFILIGISSLVIFGIMLTNSDLLMDRILDSLNEKDLSERDIIWEKFYTFASFKPIMGYGYSGYEHLSQIIFSSQKSTHNVILETYILGGIIGLLIFAILNITYIRNSIITLRSKNQKLAPTLLIAYFSSIASLQLFTLKILWIIIALNSINIIKKKKTP